MKLDPTKTAVLTLDLQKGILSRGENYASIIPAAAQVVEFARRKKYQIIHVGLGFSEGHPEISDLPSLFLQVKQNNLFVKGSPTAAFHEAILQPHDLIVYKQRVSAFSDNHLQMILRARGIDHLIIFGIATSGIVLSTVTRAFDLDFQLTVIKDACFDTDEEVHRVLTEKYFPKRGTVTTAGAFIAAQS